MASRNLYGRRHRAHDRGTGAAFSCEGIISDCGFTSAWDVFASVLKDQYHLPAFPILNIADKWVQDRAGYRLAQCNNACEVKKCQVPVLLIHGDADNFVPSRMCREIYDNCPGEKDILIVHGAGHAECFYKAKDQYEEKLTEFLEKEETEHENRKWEKALSADSGSEAAFLLSEVLP